MALRLEMAPGWAKTLLPLKAQKATSAWLKPGIERARTDGADILDRPCRGLGDGDQPRDAAAAAVIAAPAAGRVADHAGDHAPQDEERAAALAGADAEIAHILRCGRAGQKLPGKQGGKRAQCHAGAQEPTPRPAARQPI